MLILRRATPVVSWLVAAAFGGWPAAGGQQALGPRTQTFEIGAGTSAVFESRYVPTADGACQIWALSSEVDLMLRVGPAGEPSRFHEDDDGGGGTTPFIGMDVAGGQELVVRVSAREGRAGSGTLVVRETYETEASRAAVENAGRRLGEAEALRGAGDVERARAELVGLVDDLRAEPQAEQSFAIQKKLAAAATLAYHLGLDELQASLWRALVEFHVKHFPDGHGLAIQVRLNLASALNNLARHEEAETVAREAFELVTAHPQPTARLLSGAHMALGGALLSLGKADEARRHFETDIALRVEMGAQPVDLLRSQSNLAAALMLAGEVESARALLEPALRQAEQVFPGANHLPIAIRRNLAWTRKALGDGEAARDLEREALAGVDALYPPGHPERATVRINLASTLCQIESYAEARDLLVPALAEIAEDVPAWDGRLILGRTNLALCQAMLGEGPAAVELLERVVADVNAGFPADSYLTLGTRVDLAKLREFVGDHAGAREILDDVAHRLRQTLPAGHPTLRKVEVDLALARARSGSIEPREVRDLIWATRASLRDLGRLLAPRQLERLAISYEEQIDRLLGLVEALEPAERAALDGELFELIESARGVAAERMRLASLVAIKAGDEHGRLLREEVARASNAVARQASAGSLEAGFFGEVSRREEAQRALHAHLLSLPGVLAALGSADPACIAEALEQDEAAVAYWRYGRPILEAGPGPLRFEDRYLAFVLDHAGKLARVDLGPASEIDAAIERWRSPASIVFARGVGVAGDPSPDTARSWTAGEDLRRRVMDPLRAHLGQARRIVVAADDALHLVSLDALPDAEGYLGDVYRISNRSTLRELTVRGPASLHPPSLLCMGGIDYGPALDGEGLAGLPGTEQEVAAVQSCFHATFEAARAVHVLRASDATVEALAALAPSVRYLHLATHAWFAPESVPSMLDLGSRSSGSNGIVIDPEEQVVGYAPMLLCGIALAGANAPRDAVGKKPGTLTAEELAGLDLSGCELAVLSACETNIGIRRAGQGIHSLQAALHAAGARSVISSLWKVDDAATRRLMQIFYDELWRSGRQKGEALWAAKTRLREEGHPQLDWAGWVLTGAPR